MVHSVSAGEDPARHYGRERRGRFPTYALAIVLAFFIGGRIFQTAWPAGDPADNDDFRFGLTTPALAFGLPIFGNRNERSVTASSLRARATSISRWSNPCPVGPIIRSQSRRFCRTTARARRPVDHRGYPAGRSNFVRRHRYYNVMTKPAAVIPEPGVLVLALVGG